VLIRGDARFLPLADASVDCCITSPPYYGLRDYGHAGQIGQESSLMEYVSALVKVFREVRRALKDEGTVWLNLGDSYAASPVGSFNGGGFTDSSARSGGRDLSGVATSGVLDKVKASGLKPKDLMLIPARVALALQGDGWYLRADIVWAKPNCMPESVTDRPTRAHEFIFLLSKSARYAYDGAAIREAYSESTLREFREGYDGAATKDYASVGVQNPSAVKKRIVDKQRGHSRRHAGFNDRWDAMPKDEQQQHGANKRTVWTVSPQPFTGAHFATMPEKLVEPCILAGCKLGGLVLDPFCGSGTVIAVAERLGRRGVGVDLSYQDLARERTAQRGLRFEASQ
jgi:DNA modification methylase